MKKNKLILLLIGILLIAGVGVVAYSFLNKGTPKENIREQEKEKEPEVIEPVKKVEIIDLDSKSRPLAVMINNNSAVWKYQSGLNDAYIVYELLVEGGITREMALFKDSSAPKIQSIRSSRHYYLDYAMENDAIYVHWGWSPQAQSDIRSLGINNINGLTYENTYFFRDKTVSAGYEHKGYTTMEYMNKAIERLKYRTTSDKANLLNYSVDSLDLASKENHQGADNVALKFSSYTVKFKYDKENGIYLKTQNNTDMYDYTTKERMNTKNIIVYQVNYSRLQGDNKGRLNMNNIGSGKGYFISEGIAVPITWSKSSRSEQTKYKFEDGTDLVVNDGRTYIEVLPNNGSITITADAPQDVPQENENGEA